MGEGTVFNGDTLPGPAPGPFGPEEGDVFNGISLQGGVTGGDSGGGGLGLGYGTLFPPNPQSTVPTVPGGPLVLTAMAPGNPVGAFETYMQYNAASGGTPPYTWELVGGALPAGTAQSIAGTTGFLDQIFGNYLLQPGPYSYTLQVTDSSGIVSVNYVRGGTYTATDYQDEVLSTADNQLIMVVCVTANESPTSAVAEITGINTNGNALTFTRVFHDESFSYSDSSGDATNPVATISVDIFTAPAPTQLSATLGYIAAGSGSVSKGTVRVFVVNGLADINNPFDSGHSPSAFPNVATNLTGTASAPTNTGITTSAGGELLFAITLNHTTGGGADAAPTQDTNGWVPLPGSVLDNHGGSSGFSFFAASKLAATVQDNITVTAGFTDNFWYQAIFAFVGLPGGSQQTATATVTGNVTPVVPGTTTIEGPANPDGLVLGGNSTGVALYFTVPPYNTLMIELFAGTDGETEIASTFGARYFSGGSENTIILNQSDFGAPPPNGPIQYSIPGGSPPGHIVFSWS